MKHSWEFSHVQANCLIDVLCIMSPAHIQIIPTPENRWNIHVLGWYAMVHNTGKSVFWLDEDWNGNWNSVTYFQVKHHIWAGRTFVLFIRIWLAYEKCMCQNKHGVRSRCETAGTVTGKSHGCPYSVWDLANNKGLFGALLGGNLAWITTYPAISIAYVPLSKDSQRHSSWWVDLIRSCKCALF